MVTKIKILKWVTSSIAFWVALIVNSCFGFFKENKNSGFTFLMETIGRDLLELSLNTVEGNELLLSVHIVVSDDDLLNEILVRLPVVSLVLFKSVSKRWLSIIKSPTFIRRRSQIPNIDHPSGFFIQRDSKTSLYGFAPLDIRIRSRLETTFKTEACNSSNATVLQSCNGLFLCSVKPGKLCVYNPTVSLFKVLPEPHYYKPKLYNFTRMAFDPTKSPHYKVVHAAPIDDDYPGASYRMQTYSSETGIWSIVCSRSDPFEGLGVGTYCNDAIHWINHDVNGALHYKLDFVNKTVVLTKIQLPVTMDTVDNYCKLSKSRGCLLLLGMDKTHSHDQLNVYEMGNGDSEWFLKYSVNQWGISLGGVWFIALEEREEDSFMVIELSGKVVLYDFVLKTFRGLPEVQLMLPKIRYSSTDSFLFTASFASV